MLPTSVKAGLIASVTRLVNQPFIAWLILQPTSIHPHSCTAFGGVEGDVVGGVTGGIQVTCGAGPGLGLAMAEGVGAGSARVGPAANTETLTAAVPISAMARQARRSRRSRPLVRLR
ncbi:hypothetical protein [Nonomuraea sp. NPDC001699]